MDTANFILDTIENIKEKLTDKEYKDILDALKVHVDTPNTLYRVDVYYTTLDAHADESGKEYTQFLSLHTSSFSFTTRLKKCPCERNPCDIHKIYEGDGKCYIVSFNQLGSLLIDCSIPDFSGGRITLMTQIKNKIIPFRFNWENDEVLISFTKIR